jgi:HK97 family phage portal protein
MWFRIFGRRAASWWGSLLNPVVGPQHAAPLGTMNGANDSGTAFSDTRAMQISAVFSCVRLLSETTATLPLILYRSEEKTNSRKRATDHHAYPLMTSAPNPQMTALEFREALTAQLAMYGNGYATIVRDGANRPLFLYPLRSDRLQVIRLKSGAAAFIYSVDVEALWVDVAGTTYTAANVGVSTERPQNIALNPADVFHVKGFGSDGYVGYSPLALAGDTHGLAVAAERYAGTFYASGGKPTGVLMLDRLLTPKQRADIKETFGAMQFAEMGSLWVLEASMKYQPITIAPAEAQLLDSRRFSILEIARYFRVPPHLIFDMEKATTWGSGLEQQNMAFLQYSLMPYLKRWEGACDKFLLTEDERKTLYHEHLVDALMRADSTARAEVYTKYVNNGIMARNEIRRAENLPAVDGGDTLTVRSDLVPLDRLSMPPQPKQTKGASNGSAPPA